MFKYVLYIDNVFIQVDEISFFTIIDNYSELLNSTIHKFDIDFNYSIQSDLKVDDSLYYYLEYNFKFLLVGKVVRTS